MNQHVPDWLLELDELTESLCERDLTAKERERFNQLLRSSKEARTRFAELMQLHSSLEWRIGDPLAVASFVESMDLSRESSLLSHDEVDSADQHLDDTADSQATLASQTVSRHIARFARRPMTLSLTVATLIMGALLTAMCFIVPPIYQAMRDRGDQTRDYEIVAELTGLQEAEWEVGQVGMHHGAKLPVGHRLKLTGGIAEVVYRNGARVVLEAPAEFELLGDNSGLLQQGKLVAQVQSESAKGFSIQTPHSEVVDLGTQFAVAVSPDENTDVTVIEGQVNARSLRDPAQPVQLLAAGQSLRVVRDGTMVKRKFSEEPFRQLLTASFPTTLFREGFEVGPHKAEHENAQSVTGLDLTVNNFYRGWTSTGKTHAVDRAPGNTKDWAAMFFADHALTSPRIKANTAGQTYRVEFDAGPGVYAEESQKTTSSERLRFEIVSGQGDVIHEEIFDPEDWDIATGPATLPLSPGSFTYFGDGTGSIRIRISGTTNNPRFHGVVDNLRVTKDRNTP